MRIILDKFAAAMVHIAYGLWLLVLVLASCVAGPFLALLGGPNDKIEVEDEGDLWGG